MLVEASPQSLTYMYLPTLKPKKYVQMWGRTSKLGTFLNFLGITTTDLYKNKDKMVKKYSFFSQITDRPNQIETVPIKQGEVAGTCTCMYWEVN